LQAIPDARKRAALLDGDWEAMSQVQGALWSKDNIDETRVHTAPETLNRVVVAVDPAVTFTDSSDSTGIIVAASSSGGKIGRHYFILEDLTLKAEPAEWASAAVRAWQRTQADYIVYESNQGGLAVRDTLRTAAQTLINREEIDRMPVIVSVHASRGKAVRAEPISALYQAGRVHHVGQFLALEEQLTTWTPDAPKSPDRLDALVWALTRLSKTTTGIAGSA